MLALVPHTFCFLAATPVPGVYPHWDPNMVTFCFISVVFLSTIVYGVSAPVQMYSIGQGGALVVQLSALKFGSCTPNLCYPAVDLPSSRGFLVWRHASVGVRLKFVQRPFAQLAHRRCHVRRGWWLSSSRAPPPSVTFI